MGKIDCLFGGIFFRKGPHQYNLLFPKIGDRAIYSGLIKYGDSKINPIFQITGC